MPKPKLKVALLQISPPNSTEEEAFISRGETYCRQAAKNGADVVLFPELWNIGYTFPSSKSKVNIDDWQKRAVKKNSRFVKIFQNLAKELGVAIVITYLEDFAKGHRPRNSATLFDRFGNECLHYSKVHTCDFTDEILTEHGEKFRVGTLSTKMGQIEIGLMICFDREQPESARVLMLEGAEIVLVPNACDLTKPAINQFSARAFEDMVGVAMANYPAPKNNGLSVAFSPIVFAKDNSSVDNLLVEANEQEGIYMCEFDMFAIRQWRKKMAWGKKYRQPDTYGELVV